MIKYLFYSCLLLSLPAAGQINDTAVKLVHYVLPSFTQGEVRLRSGESYVQSLNYNVITREMIFEKNGEYLAFAHPEEVDTVFVDNRKFIPAGDGFYEYLGGAVFPLFAEYTCTIKESGAETGFGTTNTTAAVAVKSLQKDAGAYKLKLPDEYKIIPRRSYYIRKEGKYYKVKNEQQVAKLFPDKKQVIRDWVQNNHTDFSKSADLLALLDQIQ